MVNVQGVSLFRLCSWQMQQVLFEAYRASALVSPSGGIRLLRVTMTPAFSRIGSDTAFHSLLSIPYGLRQ